jgi:hypothetical protein
MEAVSEAIWVFRVSYSSITLRTQRIEYKDTSNKCSKWKKKNYLDYILHHTWYAHQFRFYNKKIQNLIMGNSQASFSLFIFPAVLMFYWFMIHIYIYMMLSWPCNLHLWCSS